MVARCVCVGGTRYINNSRSIFVNHDPLIMWKPLQMNINAVFSKNEKARKPGWGPYYKSKLQYALLYKPKWNSRGS